MLALALLVHLALAAPDGDAGGPAPEPADAPGEALAPVVTSAADAPSPAGPGAGSSNERAADEGTGSAAGALDARPDLLLPTPAAGGALGRGAPRSMLGGRELVMAGLGTLAGDVLVLGAGYGVLQLFAHDVIDPSAANFRRAAFTMTGAALVIPPLLAVLAARLVAPRHAGSTWRALLLAGAGHALALAAGYWASPQLWAFVPAQLVGVTTGTMLGLRWGGGREREKLAAPARTPGRRVASAALRGECPVAG